MKFIAAVVVWLIVGSVLGWGLLKVANGASALFLFIPALLIVVWVGKVGYKSH